MSKVFLAAGHYPAQPGAGFEGFYEHDEAVRWVARIVEMDADFGYVVEVPTGDLKSKTRFVNTRAQSSDIAVEIHFNAAANAAGQRVGDGCVTLYMPGSEHGRVLAEECQKALVAAMQNRDRGTVEGWYRGNRERGAYYFLERTRCPAVILEPEFVHHKDIIVGRREAACRTLYEVFTSHLMKERS